MRRLRILVVMVVLAAGSGLGCTSPKPSVTPPSKPAPAPVGPQTFSVSVDATSGSIPLAADEYFPSDFQVIFGSSITSTVIVVFLLNLVFNHWWPGIPRRENVVGTAVEHGAVAGKPDSP